MEKEMEKEKNIILMVVFNLKVNILMMKDMEQGKIIPIMNYLKEYI